MKTIILTVTNDLTYDQRMQKSCASLAKAGFDVLLVGRSIPKSAPLKEFPFCQKRLKCFFNKGKLFYLEYNLRLFFFLLTQKHHIICAVDLDTILPAIAISNLKGSKVGYDAHEYFPEVPEVADRKLVKKAWQMVERFSVPRTHFRYTVSASIAHELRQKYGVPFELVRNAPLLVEQQVPENESDKFIIYQGALNKGRGLENLILAMHQIPIKLKIVGEGDLSAELRKLVADKNLTDKVEFLGYVAPSELASITSQAYIGYNLLEFCGLSYYYSLSNKFFDYIHALVPCITNDFPEYRAINNEIEVATYSTLEVGSIAETVNKLVHQKDYYQMLKDNCRKARLIYNWQNEERTLINIYKDL